jgi:hypothetical protein
MAQETPAQTSARIVAQMQANARAANAEAAAKAAKPSGK